MPAFKDQRVVAYTPEQMFELVANVERYPEFLPWCAGTTISQRSNESFIADLEIGFEMIKESYRSRVILTPHSKVEVDYIHGPFKELYNIWTFTPYDGNKCLLAFELDFKLKSGLLSLVLEPVFNQASHKMIEAFENRAKSLHN